MNRAQELSDGRGGRPGLPVPNSQYGLCGREAILDLNQQDPNTCEITHTHTHTHTPHTHTHTPHTHTTHTHTHTRTRTHTHTHTN